MSDLGYLSNEHDEGSVGHDVAWQRRRGRPRAPGEAGARRPRGHRAQAPAALQLRRVQTHRAPRAARRPRQRPAGALKPLLRSLFA